MQIVTVRKNTLVRYGVFVLILVVGFGVTALSQGFRPETTEISIYFVDAQMLRLIPVKTEIPIMNKQKTAREVLRRLTDGRDDNPKIRRIIPKIKGGMTVKVIDEIAYVDISDEMVEKHPDGRDLEMLTVYSIVNSLTCIDGIVNVRFTIDGKKEKNFKGYIDMRETFIPDYFI